MGLGGKCIRRVHNRLDITILLDTRWECMESELGGKRTDNNAGCDDFSLVD